MLSNQGCDWGVQVSEALNKKGHGFKPCICYSDLLTSSFSLNLNLNPCKKNSNLQN